MRREIHFSLVILVATKIAGLALTTRIEEILGGFILTRLLQFLSNSEKCVSCRDKMYVHVQQDDDKDMEMFYFMTALDAGCGELLPLVDSPLLSLPLQTLQKMFTLAVPTVH